MHLFICINKHFCMYLWTCYASNCDGTIQHMWNRSSQFDAWHVKRYVSIQKRLCILYILNKCIQHRIADIINYILTLNINGFTTKTSKNVLLSLIFSLYSYCFGTCSNVAIRPLLAIGLRGMFILWLPGATNNRLQNSNTIEKIRKCVSYKLI